MDSLLSMLGFGRGAAASSSAPPHPIAQGPDDDVPAAGGNALACFGAGCFWGVELAFQRVPGVTKTEVGYTQGNTHMPTYEDVCGGRTGVFGCRTWFCAGISSLHGFGFCFSSGGIMHFGFQSHFERDDSIVSNVNCGELGISICVLMCGELVISLLREAEF